MAKGLRSSGIKKNKQALKKRVFGPVEEARNERLNAKLMELAQAPKAQRTGEMEVEALDATKNADTSKPAQTEPEMEVDETASATTKTPRSKREIQRLREARQERNEKKRHRKVTNRLTFATHPRKRKGGK